MLEEEEEESNIPTGTTSYLAKGLKLEHEA
jgi:hypothetical protein